MKTSLILVMFAAVAFIGVVALALAIALGGPAQPAPMRSMSRPFESVDFSGVSDARRFAARDGAQLAYRAYAAAEQPARGSVVLIHGSSSRSVSVHPLAAGLARAGYSVYALDMRGHGESGVKGQIAYVGQLDDDVEDFVKTVLPAGRKTLIGFSSGGGFALRFAGGPKAAVFDAYLLLAPFIHQDAPTAKAGAGGWAAVGVPRIVALTILNGIGITAFNDLPVIAYALGEEEGKFLTPWYSYALATNFRPRFDYRADIVAVAQPMEVVAGADDEVFFADRYESLFAQAGHPVRVTIVPGLGHIEMVLHPAAAEAAVSALKRLDRQRGR